MSLFKKHQSYFNSEMSKLDFESQKFNGLHVHLESIMFKLIKNIQSMEFDRYMYIEVTPLILNPFTPTGLLVQSKTIHPFRPFWFIRKQFTPSGPFGSIKYNR